MASSSDPSLGNLAQQSVGQEAQGQTSRHDDPTQCDWKDLFESLIGSLDDVVWSASVEPSRILYVNSAVERVYGRPAQDFYENPNLWFEVVAAEDREQASESAAHLIEDGRTTCEYRIVRPDGSTRWILDRKNVVYSDDGKPLRIGGIAADITEQKAIAKKLQLTQFSVDSSQNAIFWIEPDGRFSYVNRAACATLGYSHEDLLTLSVFDIAPDMSSEAWTEHWNRLRKDGASAYEARHRRKDGTVFPVDVTSHYVHFDEREFVFAFAADISDRRQATEHLRQFFEISVDMLCIAGFDGYLKMVSAAFERMMGHRTEELVNRPFMDFIHPDDHESTRKSLEALAMGETVIDFENRCRHRDGTYRWLDWRGAAAVEEGLFFAIARDVTERKQNDEWLSEQNRLSQSIQRIQSRFISDATPTEVFEELLSTLISVSDSEYGFIGDVLRDEHGKPYLKTRAITNIAWNEETRKFYDEFAPDAMEFHNLQTLFGAVMTTGQTVVSNQPQSDSRRGGIPVGHPALNSFLGIPLFWEGDLVGMAGIANRPGGYQEEWIESQQPLLGVCASLLGAYRLKRMRNEAIDALRESELRFRELASHINEVFWLMDWNSGDILYVSPTYATLWGHSNQSAYDDPKAWVQHIHPDDRRRVTTAFSKMAASGEYDEEFRVDGPDGQKWVRDRAYPIRDNAGQFYRIARITEDITPQKQAAQQRRRHHDELVHVGRLSTMGEMMAGLAHEINQPLYAIANYSAACSKTLASDQNVDLDKIRRWIEKIAAQADRTGKIINRLGKFVRKADSHRSTTDLNETIHEALEFVNVKMRQHRASVTLELSEPSPLVLVDRVQIQQVLINLLQNAFEALDAIPIQHRHVVVRSKLTDETVEVSVEDNGPGFGVDPNRLFDTFFTSKQDGFGMGLAISRSIVDDHGGMLWATPNADQGATFHLTLSIVKPAPS